MSHEIKIGGVSLVVEDPRGQLARAAESEQRVEHQEAEALEASVRTVQNRPSAPVINTVDPMGSFHARAQFVGTAVGGKQGVASLAMTWMLFGTPMIVFGTGIAARLYDDWRHLHGAPLQTRTIIGLVAEIGIVLGMSLLVGRTARVIRERRSRRGT